MDFDKLFPGRFMKAGDLGGRDYTLEVAGIAVEELEGDAGKKVKGILSFKGAKKSLVLNRTNGECIKAMFGRETDAWVGKRVTFYADVHDGEPCIRVRGSPDIGETFAFELKLPRKKARQIRLQKMVAKGGASPAAPATAPTPPAAPAEERPWEDEPPPGTDLPTLQG